MTLYSLHNIKKNYNGRIVLDVPELNIKSGNIYTLSGPNGAGKTTLLNILGFLLPPSAGTLSFRNYAVVYSEKHLRQLRKSVVLVDQHPILFSASVFKNIEFGLKVRKIPHKNRSRIIESSLERVGMEKFIHADARYLSGGETRRIAIARALACSPEVLLLDEPTADLDLESQVIIEKIILDIHRHNRITILFCSHNISQIFRLTRKNIHLFDGRLCDSLYENIFKGKVLKKENQYFCKINENILIPIQPTPNNTVKIAINPNSVKIKDDQSAESKQTLFKGKIIQLTEEKDRIRAAVDIGMPINMLIEKSTYYSQPVCIGKDVTIYFDNNEIIDG